jgi:polyisoprenoid-binding protein YceI
VIVDEAARIIDGMPVPFSGTIHVEADPEQSWAEVSIAHTEINRGDWGLTWNQALETGGVLLGTQITIQAEIQAVPQRNRPERPE